MSIPKNPPNTIYLGGGLPGGEGGATVVNEYSAGAAITPGMLIELYRNGSGKMQLRPHASATAVVAPWVATEQIQWNKTVDDAYAINDLVNSVHLRKGSTFWGLVPSGQDISNGEFLQSNGDGKLKSASATTADANVAQFQSLDNLGAVTADTRCRVLVL